MAKSELQDRANYKPHVVYEKKKRSVKHLEFNDRANTYTEFTILERIMIYDIVREHKIKTKGASFWLNVERECTFPGRGAEAIRAIVKKDYVKFEKGSFPDID